MYRLAVVTTHPVQYNAPWFRHLAQRADVEVFYGHRQTPGGQSAAGFGVEFEWDRDLLSGYRHHWLRNVARRPGGSSFFGYDTPEIGGELARGGFDAVVIFGWNTRMALQTVAAARALGMPALMRGDSHLGQRRARWKRAAKYPLYRALLPRVAHLYVGRLNRVYLEHYGVPAQRLFFAPHCVDNAFFRAGSARARASGEAVRLRDALGIPRDAFVVAAVGKLLPNKRVRDLVAACAAAAATHPDANVYGLVVGDGPERASLEAQAASCGRMRFAGFRNQTELPAVYAAADAVVLGSESETWGLVVNEAMACGLPAIVSTGVGCAPDLIDEERTGLVYPTGDVNALARALLRLRSLQLTNPVVLADAVVRKLDMYSVETATQGLEEAVRTLRHSPKSPREGARQVGRGPQRP